MSRGRFITFEGIDGSGKSTQARRLAEALRESGSDPVLSREPGGAPGAEAIRHLLVEGAPERWSPETETLLFTAARRDHLERTILPALEAGRDVVCDRFADSTRVYQGTVRADLRGLVDRLHEAAIGLEPDLTFLIDIEPDEAWRRSTIRGGAEARFEAFGPDFQRALREGFLALASAEPQRVQVIDGNRAEDAVAADIAARASAR